jgi:uncharacterized membrane protein HdeD (DUF308 family)
VFSGLVSFALGIYLLSTWPAATTVALKTTADVTTVYGGNIAAALR